MIQPEQPTFPQTQVNMTNDGMVLTIMLAPGLTMQQAFGEEMMNRITTEWLKTRKAVKEQMAIIQDIKRSRVN